jgi:glycosyltransferase involved in cell wall biosynthesis
MKKIAIFFPSLRTGGAERNMIRLANEIVRRGYQVDLVLLRAQGELRASIAPQVQIIDLKIQRTLLSLPSLIAYLNSAKPDAMLSATTHCNSAAILARFFSGWKGRLVISERSTLSQKLARSTKLIDRVLRKLAELAYPHADARTSVSAGVADDLAQTLHLRRDSIQVLYNPIVSPELYQQAAETPPHPWFHDGGAPIILAAGRLTEAKDYPTLVRALSILQTRRPARLLILGEGETRPALEQQISELGGLTETVSLPGLTANPFCYMANCAVFVLSSAWEGLPTVLIEAMACGAQVVSTDCHSGPNEILENGKYGKLVPVGDALALANAIEHALDNPKPVEMLKDRGAFFSLEQVTTDYLNVLLGLA